MTTNKIKDQQYLRNFQYHCYQNLETRIQFHHRFSTNPLGWYPWVVEKINLQPDHCLLDIGCGMGNLWLATADTMKFNFKGHLADFSFGMVAVAKQALSFDKRFTFTVADAQLLPFKEQCFDTILANHMLYHIPDINRTLQEFKRVLKPGGRLIAATNGVGHMQELYDLLHKYVPAFDHRDASTQRFGLEDSKKILEQIFQNVEIYRYQDSLWITEADLLMAYIDSMIKAEIIPNNAKKRIKDEIINEIAVNGGLKIQKSVGMAVAW